MSQVVSIRGRQIHRPFWPLLIAMLALLTPASARALQEPPRPILDNLNFSDPQAVEQRADLFMVRKFFPEAIQLYERLTRMNPKNAAYFNKLGIAHHQNQNLRGARDALAALYRSRLAPEAMRERKAARYAQLKSDYAELKRAWGGFAGYDVFFDNINNAQLAAHSIDRKSTRLNSSHT